MFKLIGQQAELQAAELGDLLLDPFGLLCVGAWNNDFDAVAADLSDGHLLGAAGIHTTVDGGDHLLHRLGVDLFFEVGRALVIDGEHHIGAAGQIDAPVERAGQRFARQLLAHERRQAHRGGKEHGAYFKAEVLQFQQVGQGLPDHKGQDQHRDDGQQDQPDAGTGFSRRCSRRCCGLHSGRGCVGGLEGGILKCNEHGRNHGQIH